MGLYDRDYTRENFQYQFRSAPHMRLGFPRITPVVKHLLIINVSVFLVSIIIRPLGVLLYGLFQFDPTTWLKAIQLWRLITYQFLHGSVMHLFFNMLGLYFLGPTLERHWQGKRFLIFYLGCGTAGALFYLFLVAVGFLPPLAMVGASGAILGMLAACAILFPQFVVFILLFPVPIRVAAVAFTVIYLVAVLSKGANAGGDAAHLAGMVAGAVYVWSENWRADFFSKIRSNRWNRKSAEYRKIQFEVDRILKKVHESGIHSLSLREKRTLKKATRAEQSRNA